MKIIFALLSYLIGSIPTGYILFYISEKKDIRNFGSHTTGATNVFRVKGWKLALPVFVLDFLKGLLPVLLALKLFGDQPFAALCGFLTAFGHCFPVFLKFRGGKGMATATGALALLAWKPLLAGLVVFIPVVVFSRYVSLASLLAALSFPFFVYLFKEEVEIIRLSLAIFLLIVFRHWGNIGRLVKGTEQRIGEKSK